MEEGLRTDVQPARSGKRECARGLAKARRVGGLSARLRGQRGSLLARLAGSGARPADIRLPPRRVQRWLAASAGAGACTGRVAQEEAREEASGERAALAGVEFVSDTPSETTAHRPAPRPSTPEAKYYLGSGLWGSVPSNSALVTEHRITETPARRVGDFVWLIAVLLRP